MCCARSSLSASVLAPRTARKASRVPGVAPVSSRDCRSAASRLVVAHGDDAAEQVRVAADELRRRLHGHVGAERQWTLIERRREGVVDAEDRALLPRCRADRVQITDGQQRIRRRLQPDQVRRAAQLDPARRVGHRDALYRPSAAFLTGVGEARDALVAVVGQRHDRARSGADRKPPRCPPCRKRTPPRTRPRGRRRSLPTPPRSECRRRASRRGGRPARSSRRESAVHSAAHPGAGRGPRRPTRTQSNLSRARCAASRVASLVNPTCHFARARSFDYDARSTGRADFRLTKPITPALVVSCASLQAKI